MSSNSPLPTAKIIVDSLAQVMTRFVSFDNGRPSYVTSLAGRADLSLLFKYHYPDAIRKILGATPEAGFRRVEWGGSATAATLPEAYRAAAMTYEQDLLARFGGTDFSLLLSSTEEEEDGEPIETWTTLNGRTLVLEQPVRSTSAALLLYDRLDAAIRDERNLRVRLEMAISPGTDDMVQRVIELFAGGTEYIPLPTTVAIHGL